MKALRSQGRIPATFLMTALALGLSACGGGDDDPVAPTPTPAPTISGTVIDGPIKGATVCFDLNGNGDCDASEPMSGPTDENGRYTISGFASEDLAGAPCIATVPADAIDMDDPGNPVGTAFEMSAPAGKCGVITPITTLVQTAVAGGMTLAEAEAAVARQLMISDVASVYLNYVDNPTEPDSEALAALATQAIVPALKAGAQLTTQQQSLSPQRIDDFEFVDANNYYLRWFEGGAAVDAEGQIAFTDQRRKLENGAWRPISELYDTALALTESGEWIRCDESASHRSTVGSPSVANYCGGDLSSQVTVSEDVSGKSIADIVRRAQAAESNSLRGIDPDLLPAANFPDGANIQVRLAGYALTYNIRYRESDGSVPNVATLEQMIAAYPVPASPEHGNTVAASSLFNDPWKRYRVAFGPNGFAQYYVCDVQQNLFTVNCQNAGTGGYAVATVRGSRVVSFSGHPAESNPALFSIRVFVERDGRVYYGFQNKPGPLVEKIRLNSVAFEALAQLLGIVPPWQQAQ